MAVQQGGETFFGGAAVRRRVCPSATNAELHPAPAVLHVRRSHRALLVPAYTEPRQGTSHTYIRTSF